MVQDFMAFRGLLAKIPMCKFWVFASRYLVAQTRSCFVSKTMFTPAIPYLEEYDPFD